MENRKDAWIVGRGGRCQIIDFGVGSAEQIGRLGIGSKSGSSRSGGGWCAVSGAGGKIGGRGSGWGVPSARGNEKAGPGKCQVAGAWGANCFWSRACLACATSRTSWGNPRGLECRQQNLANRESSIGARAEGGGERFAGQFGSARRVLSAGRTTDFDRDSDSAVGFSGNGVGSGGAPRPFA